MTNAAITMMTTATTAAQIEALGGQRWTSPDKRITRVYLKGERLAQIIGLEVSRYKSGNISGGTLAGESISNAEARRLADSTVYWQDGDLYVQTASRRGDDVLAAVHAALGPAEDEEPAEEPSAPAEPAGVEPVEPSPSTAMIYMLPVGKLNQLVAERGPRWAVSATVRPHEHCVGYYATAEEAERARDKLAAGRYRNVRVHAPHSVDLAPLGQARAEAKRKLDEATAVLRAGVLQALADGREETEVARAAGVDRMTVRSWAGK